MLYLKITNEIHVDVQTSNGRDFVTRFLRKHFVASMKFIVFKYRNLSASRKLANFHINNF